MAHYVRLCGFLKQSETPLNIWHGLDVLEGIRM